MDPTVEKALQIIEILKPLDAKEQIAALRIVGAIIFKETLVKLDLEGI